jgi:hypothetical protein
MIRKLLLLASAFALVAQTVYTQGSSASATQAKAGELVRLNENLTLKTTATPKSAFPKVKLKGEPFVVVLELDAGNKETLLSYHVSPEAKSSGVALTVGNQRLAPRAVIEDFPSWGEDNDKEVELVTPQDSGFVSLSFKKAGSVLILFDLPPGQAAAPKKLSLVLKTTKPTEGDHKLDVTF